MQGKIHLHSSKKGHRQQRQISKRKKQVNNKQNTELQTVPSTHFVARPFQIVRDRERIERYHTEMVVLQNELWRKLAMLAHDPNETRRMLRNRQEGANFVAQLHRMTAQREGQALILDTSTGEPVGYVFITESVDPLSKERMGIIGEMFIEEPWRKQGAGTFALQEAEKWLTARGTFTFQIFVTKINVDAVHMYQKNGYSVVDYRMIKRVSHATQTHDVQH